MNYKKALALSILVMSITGCWVTGEGQKAGIIVKLAREGAFNKTFEAELIRGGLSSGSGVNGKSFHFTIENPLLAEKIESAFENQKEVIIKYHTEAITGCARGETNTFLDDVIIKGEQA